MEPTPSRPRRWLGSTFRALSLLWPWNPVWPVQLRLIVVYAPVLLGLAYLWRANEVDRAVHQQFAPVAAVANDPEDLVVRLTHEIYRMHRDYRRRLEAQGIVDYQESFDVDLEESLRAGGVCAHRSLLLVSALRSFGIPARKLLLVYKNNLWANHVVAEAYVDGRWRVIDPLFGYIYRRADGEMATVEEIRADPGIIARAVAADTDPFLGPYPIDDYKYDRTMRFNWLKNSVTKAAAAWIGPQADEWEPPYVLNRGNRVRGYALLFVGGLFFLIELGHVVRTRGTTSTLTHRRQPSSQGGQIQPSTS